REASYALGVPKWKTIMKIVLPTAISGILSGITIAIARVIGETAPIMVTAGFAASVNWNVFSGWMSTLPTFIYDSVTRPTAPGTAAIASTDRAWAAALVLIVIVMLLNLGARILSKVLAPKSGRSGHRELLFPGQPREQHPKKKNFNAHAEPATSQRNRLPRPPEAVRTQNTGGKMSKQIDIEDLNIFYGDFRAVEGVSMTIEPKSVT